MSQATFTVPATAVYTSARNGGRYKYKAGVVLPLDEAIDLGMPGATAAAPANPFGAAQAAWLEGHGQTAVTGDETSIDVDADVVSAIFGSTAGSVAEGDHAHTLAALTDATITDPQNGDVLTYDAGSGTWKNVAPA